MNYLKKSGASERRFYQKITDIYSECSADKFRNNKTILRKSTKQIILGNLWFNCSRVLELITKSHIWTWKDGPGKKIHKSDVSIAKNYLTEEELSELNHIVS